MSQRVLRKSWAVTRGHLDQAFGLLPDDTQPGDEGGAFANYHEWLVHNGLELALDELEMLGDANNVSPEFWAALLAAAREMQLHGHVDRYLAKLAG
jgi:hypothetical protein